MIFGLVPRGLEGPMRNIAFLPLLTIFINCNNFSNSEGVIPDDSNVANVAKPQQY